VTSPVTVVGYAAVMRSANSRGPDDGWVTLKGGELEWRRPKRPCAECRRRPAARRVPLCFQCYREEVARERVLFAAGRLDTASEARFEQAGPFEAVDRPRLQRLKAAHAAAQAAAWTGTGSLAARRRRAQIAARRAAGAQDAPSQRPAARLQAGVREAAPLIGLRLPESWLPFVIGG
jgi:hypothetical protein